MVNDSYSKIKFSTGKFWNVSIGDKEMNDVIFLKTLFEEAVERSNATIINCYSHEFHPQGITIIAILSDSHAVLHTWPEKKFVMAEIFTCGEGSNPRNGIMHLKKRLKPTYFTTSEEFNQI
ncbi:MAG: adenosylmethionine decarboxylase [Promethearchaeota archaeon]